VTSTKRKTSILGVCLLAVLVVGGVGYAAIPGSDGVIHACYGSNGEVRVINTEASPPATCNKGWTAFSWNQTGPPGPPGQNGQDGQDGTNGANGTNGQDGTNGVSGYEAHLSDTLVPAGFGAFAFATCSPGKVALGGGHELLESNDSQFVHVTASLPTAPTLGFDGWMVKMDIDLTSGDHLIRVFVTCADAT
jgi:hypothetical protein